LSENGLMADSEAATLEQLIDRTKDHRTENCGHRITIRCKHCMEVY
jgi:hypothetical protein